MNPWMPRMRSVHMVWIVWRKREAAWDWLQVTDYKSYWRQILLGMHTERKNMQGTNKCTFQKESHLCTSTLFDNYIRARAMLSLFLWPNFDTLMKKNNPVCNSYKGILWRKKNCTESPQISWILFSEIVIFRQWVQAGSQIVAGF